MRWFLVVALCLLVASNATAQPLVGGMTVREGETRTILFTVEKAQAVSIAFSAVVNSGGTLQLTGGNPCHDPDTGSRWSNGTFDVGLDCSILPPGTYWATMRIDHGTAAGLITVSGARMH